MSKDPSCMLNVKEANLNHRRLKAKHSQLLLDDSSDTSTVSDSTKERDEHRKSHASQTNENNTLSRQLEGIKEKCKACSKENGRLHEGVSGLSKSPVSYSTKYFKKSFMTNEYDSMKVGCEKTEKKAKNARENHVKHVTKAGGIRHCMIQLDKILACSEQVEGASQSFRQHHNARYCDKCTH